MDSWIGYVHAAPVFSMRILKFSFLSLWPRSFDINLFTPLLQQASSLVSPACPCPFKCIVKHSFINLVARFSLFLNSTMAHPSAYVIFMVKQIKSQIDECIIIIHFFTIAYFALILHSTQRRICHCLSISFEEIAFSSTFASWTVLIGGIKLCEKSRTQLLHHERCF